MWEEISDGLDHLKVGDREVNSRQYTAGFNFKGSDQQARIGKLSGGERNRVHLAKLLRSGGNLLLLDEPTNDLDVDTLRALEDALLGFPGCAVVISHDRWFLDRIATHVLAFEGDSQVDVVRGQLRGLRGAPPRAPRRRRRPPAPDHLQAARAWLSRPTAAGQLAPGTFDRDTAVAAARARRGRAQRVFAAEVSPGWRAGRGPHGGYLAAMLLRALIETVADAGARAALADDPLRPRARARPVEIRTTVERAGRSLSTLSARMEQDGTLIALALAAFSVPWTAPEIAELPMPDVAPPDAERRATREAARAARRRSRATWCCSRASAPSRSPAPSAPMEIGGWIGLPEPRPVDALVAGVLQRRLVPAVVHRARPSPRSRPTVDLTIHFRTPMPRARRTATRRRAVPRAVRAPACSTKASSRRTA